MAEQTAVIPFNDVQRMGLAIAKSGLFGVKTDAQAVALMLVAQAEGRHPASAAMDYHVITAGGVTRPSLKADSMLARFQAAGGCVKWTEYTDKRVAAEFSHPQGGTVSIDWDMERAEKAGLGAKDIWKKYPRSMLRARVISEGVRTVYPAVLGGMYTPEEVQDFEQPKEERKPRETVAEVVEEPTAAEAEPVTDDTATMAGMETVGEVLKKDDFGF